MVPPVQLGLQPFVFGKHGATIFEKTLCWRFWGCMCWETNTAGTNDTCTCLLFGWWGISSVSMPCFVEFKAHVWLGLVSAASSLSPPSYRQRTEPLLAMLNQEKCCCPVNGPAGTESRTAHRDRGPGRANAAKRSSGRCGIASNENMVLCAPEQHKLNAAAPQRKHPSRHKVNSTATPRRKRGHCSCRVSPRNAVVCWWIATNMKQWCKVTTAFSRH